MTSPDMFKVQYNTSTWKDIDDAYHANKLVILEVYSVDGTDDVLYASLTRRTSTQYVFTSVDITGIYQFTCNYIDGWSYTSKSFITSILMDTDENILLDNSGVIITGT